MTGSTEPNTQSQRRELLDLIDAAVSGDLMTVAPAGFVTVMAKSQPHIRCDIPAAFEMYTLLAHYLPALPLRTVSLGIANVLLAPAVLFDEPAGRVVALVPVLKQQLELIAYWVAGGIPSDTLRAMPGLLALPFSIERHGLIRHLIPEWFVAFYVDGNANHCVPVLSLRSITLDERFGDWVSIAVDRMPLFGLPCARASTTLQYRSQ